MTSADGITWISQVTPIAPGFAFWESLTWSPELHRLVAVGDDGGGNDIMWSDDAITWTLVDTPTTDGFIEVAWSPELRLFVAASDFGTGNMFTSPDGKNWTAQSTGTTQSWGDICWAKDMGLFISLVGFSQADPGVATSPDGVHWATANIPENQYWFGIAWSSPLGLAAAVAVGGVFADRAMSSHPL